MGVTGVDKHLPYSSQRRARDCTPRKPPEDPKLPYTQLIESGGQELATSESPSALYDACSRAQSPQCPQDVGHTGTCHIVPLYHDIVNAPYDKGASAMHTSASTGSVSTFWRLQNASRPRNTRATYSL